jgi:iron(III) transport system ATP-binding protein
VSEADVILFDEPLSNLDAKLRKEVRSEIRDLQQRLGITVLYVTHDQEEAMAISDRIVVMNDGLIKEQGAPEHIYARPSDVFAARFMGESNVLPATVLRSDGDEWVATTPLGYVRIKQHPIRFDLACPHAVLLTIRPEHVGLVHASSTAEPAPLGTRFSARARTCTFLGPFTEVLVEAAGGQNLTIRTTDSGRFVPGDLVTVAIAPDRLVVLAPDTVPEPVS